MDLEYAKYLLNKVKEDYDKIAEDFSRTRSYLPPDILYFKPFIKKGDKILDLGCGNGRLFEIVNGAEYIGVDISEKMIQVAKKRYPQAQFLVTSPLSLPFSENTFDKVFCLSVLHHIPSSQLRVQFLREIKRVLKPQGPLFITVWNLWHKPSIKKLLLKYTLLKLIGKSKLDFFDIFLPWRDSKGNAIIQRYLHVFTLHSFKKTIQNAGFKVLDKKVLKRSKKESNLFVLASPYDN